MLIVRLAIIVCGLVLGMRASADDPSRRVLEYAPAPIDNPLKGLVPYAGDVREQFPHSLEFDYLPLSALVTSEDTYDWRPLEKKLDAIAGRGHQAVVRIFVEYPGRTDGIPAFLVKDGLKVHKYLNTTEKPPTRNVTPDYNDPKLRNVLTRFVEEFGRKFDGDPRIGFITAGLLGHWGEWHTYPREELFASEDLQIKIMNAYEKAFTITPVLLRYTVGEAAGGMASNAKRGFGYHDDSFAWGTLDTDKDEDSWFFMPAMKKAGKEAIDKWKTRPIGGEIRPEAWGTVFDATPNRPEIQDFRTCVDTTHVSWLMDSGMFGVVKTTADRIRRAKAEVARMGYEFHVAAVTIGRPVASKIVLKIEVENRGNAPFYYDWPAEFALLGADGKRVKTVAATGKLTGLLPGDPARVWSETFDANGIPAGRYKLLMRVPNLLPNGRPIRFANKSQNADAEGWLTLGEIVLP